MTSLIKGSMTGLRGVAAVVHDQRDVPPACAAKDEAVSAVGQVSTAASTIDGTHAIGTKAWGVLA